METSDFLTQTPYHADSTDYKSRNKCPDLSFYGWILFSHKKGETGSGYLNIKAAFRKQFKKIGI